MAILFRYVLAPNRSAGGWELINCKEGRVIQTFRTKAEALAALRSCMGERGGVVRIYRENVKFDVERTFHPQKSARKKKPL